MIPLRRAPRSVVVGVLLLAAACGPRRPPAPEFRQDRAWSYMVQQVSFGPRVPGHRGHARQLAWLREQLASRADTVLLLRFTAPGVDGAPAEWTSVLARFRPELPERVLLVAHRDTRGRADGSPEPRDRRRPVPGAHVNASGVAVLMELAQLFRLQPPPIGIDLLFVDGDDVADTAFAGTRHFLSAMPGYRTRYAIILQGVADYDARFPVDPASSGDVVERIWGTGRALGYDSLFVPSQGPALASPAPLFAAAGIPAALVRDAEYGPAGVRWHGVDDLPAYLKRETLGAVGRVLTETLYAETPDREAPP